ncbi:MAG TPA: hypothetical protein VF843_02280 [Streptosporangiaceae bacterium]
MGWYQRVLVETGRAPAVWMLIAFLVTFAVTRAITRRIRRKAADAANPAGPAGPADEASESGKGRGFGDIYIGGVHIHHQVWGILLILSSGLLEFRYSPRSPWEEILAAAFGAGAALTLDEFALWLTLNDVYWHEAGRKSIDAILVASALGVILLVQASPVGTVAGHDIAELIGYALAVAIQLVLAILCIIKGKLATGVIGVVVPLLALAGAVRLAKPGSAWARRRYAGAKLERAERRFGPDYQRRHDRLRDLLGGGPGPPASTAAAQPPPPPARSGRSQGG